VKKPESDKQSNLLWNEINYCHEMFYDTSLVPYFWPKPTSSNISTLGLVGPGPIGPGPAGLGPPALAHSISIAISRHKRHSYTNVTTTTIASIANPLMLSIAKASV
jgi:hypothetical protein